MKNRLLWSTLLLAAALTTASCSSDDTPAAEPTFEFTTGVETGMPVMVVPGTPTTLTYKAEHLAGLTAEALPQGWDIAIDPAAGSITLEAADDAVSKAVLRLSATGSAAQQPLCEVELRCLNTFDDPAGTFILNEGNMTTENGSLTYISPEGYVLDDAYRTVNGSELGNVAQDMAFCDGKIYVISQNGNKNANGTEFENDGMLVVMDARTLKRTAAFTNDDLAGLDWPSHIAVLDEQHIYIRDNAGIHRFDATTKTLTAIEGTEDAPKSRFLTMNGKVYTYRSGSFSKILEMDTQSDVATSYSLPYRLACAIERVIGIQPANDGRIWIMSSTSKSVGAGEIAIGKYDMTTNTMTQRRISVEPEIGASGVVFAADGNNLYYADGVTLYRLPFDEDPSLKADSGLDAEQWLADLSTLDANALQGYNGPAIHPATGHLFVNTIKSFPLFTQNQVWEFDPAGAFDAPVAKYENYTNFPAGFYFPQTK